jgi:hypothetical protein
MIGSILNAAADSFLQFLETVQIPYYTSYFSNLNG